MHRTGRVFIWLQGLLFSLGLDQQIPVQHLPDLVRTKLFIDRIAQFLLHPDASGRGTERGRIDVNGGLINNKNDCRPVFFLNFQA